VPGADGLTAAECDEYLHTHLDGFLGRMGGRESERGRTLLSSASSLAVPPPCVCGLSASSLKRKIRVLLFSLWSVFRPTERSGISFGLTPSLPPSLPPSGQPYNYDDQELSEHWMRTLAGDDSLRGAKHQNKEMVEAQVKKMKREQEGGREKKARDRSGLRAIFGPVPSYPGAAFPTVLYLRLFVLCHPAAH
jgi:hypothetical protein